MFKKTLVQNWKIFLVFFLSMYSLKLPRFETTNNTKIKRLIYEMF